MYRCIDVYQIKDGSSREHVWWSCQRYNNYITQFGRLNGTTTKSGCLNWRNVIWHDHSSLSYRWHVHVHSSLFCSFFIKSFSCLRSHSLIVDSVFVCFVCLVCFTFGPQRQHKVASFDSHAVKTNTYFFGSPRGWFIPIHSQRVVRFTVLNLCVFVCSPDLFSVS